MLMIIEAQDLSWRREHPTATSESWLSSRTSENQSVER